MKELVFQNDPYKMNWLREDYEYAKVICPSKLSCRVENRKEGDIIYTEITLINEGAKPYFTHVKDIAIYFPMEDKYEDSATCLRYRCHTHIFCGGNVSYIVILWHYVWEERRLIWE